MWIKTRGVRLPSLKEPAASRAIRICSAREPICLPVGYGGASPCAPSTDIGQLLTKGEPVGQTPEGELPVFASVTGRLQRLREMTHPLLGPLACVVLQPEDTAQTDTPVLPDPHPQTETLSPAGICQIARMAGIIDELDGVPLADKLSQLSDLASATHLVADATEAEPYASSAWAVLNEAGEEVLAGLQLAARACGMAHCHIAVMLPAKFRRPLIQRLGEEQVVSVPHRYPVDRLIPGSLRPACRIGVQACLALYRAATLGERQTGCVITITGDAVANPQNVRIPFGISAKEVLELCGLAADPSYVIFGDAMTGTAVADLDMPLLPGTTCLLALKAAPVPTTRPCIGCGRCARVCHANLLPYEIVRRLENMHYERLPGLRPELCDGCGACSHICPAGREVAVKVQEARQTAEGTILLKWGDDDDA